MHLWRWTPGLAPLTVAHMLLRKTCVRAPRTGGASRSSSRTSGKACLTVLALLGLPVIALAVVLFVTFGMDSQHDSPDSILWPEEKRVYIPASATDITLSRTFFDHWARYTVATEDLHAMLASRFAECFDPDEDFAGSPVDRGRFEERYREFEWTWSEGLVSYSCWAPNGGTHDFWHDPSTGQTYQASVGW